MRACRSCKNISDAPVCPICKGTEFSDDYSGVLIVFDPENSLIAEKMKANEPGIYALRIR